MPYRKKLSKFEELESRILLAADAIGVVKDKGIYTASWEISTDSYEEHASTYDAQLGNALTVGSDFDRSFGFGTDRNFFLGDWDGDGTWEMGLTRNVSPGNPSLRHWLLDGDAIGNPDAEIDRSYGFNNDIPVVGDWDGNGVTDIGVVRPIANGAGGTVLQWLLDTDQDVNGDPDLIYLFGEGFQSPIVGDWDGDGQTDLGVTYYVGSTLFWAFDVNEDGAPDSGQSFGEVIEGTDITPVAGDWNGDGRDTPGYVRSATAPFPLNALIPPPNSWHFDNDNDGIADNAAVFGQPGDVPVVGTRSFDFAEVVAEESGVSVDANGNVLRRFRFSDGFLGLDDEVAPGGNDLRLDFPNLSSINDGIFGDAPLVTQLLQVPDGISATKASNVYNVSNEDPFAVFPEGPHGELIFSSNDGNEGWSSP